MQPSCSQRRTLPVCDASRAAVVIALLLPLGAATVGAGSADPGKPADLPARIEHVPMITVGLTQGREVVIADQVVHAGNAPWTFKEPAHSARLSAPGSRGLPVVLYLDPKPQQGRALVCYRARLGHPANSDFALASGCTAFEPGTEKTVELVLRGPGARLGRPDAAERILRLTVRPEPDCCGSGAVISASGRP